MAYHHPRRGNMDEARPVRIDINDDLMVALPRLAVVMDPGPLHGSIFLQSSRRPGGISLQTHSWRPWPPNLDANGSRPIATTSGFLASAGDTHWAEPAGN